MDDESSDILGQQTKPVLRGGKNTGSPGASLTVKLVFGFAILLGLYVVATRIWSRVLVWKERSHKLAMRRRHGIPDNDHRPFNVAYAAVLRARQEGEAAQKPKVTQPIPPNDRRNNQTEQNIRQRFGFHGTAEVPRATSHSTRVPGAYFAEGTPSRSHAESPNPPVVIGPGRFPSQPPHSLGPRRYESGVPSYLTGYRRFSRRGLDLDDVSSGQKRGLAEGLWDEQDAAKKSKRESGMFGNDADGTLGQNQGLLQRGAKRYLLDEDNEDNFVERQTRDKRARKVSQEMGIQAEEEDLDMDIDEDEDEIDDLPYIQRGKKRDRAEAGSTFGADDDDSGVDLDSPDSKPQRRTRKRRTFSERKSDAAAAARGQKRDRNLEDEDSDPEASAGTSFAVRKKRGKKTSQQEDDISENSTTRSLDSSSSRNRKIGEEWTCNGIRWKIGPNRQRLRQALVKKARQRFPMPQDSQHPDRDADFEVYVESWLNEEEYRDAKQRHLLAGQDTPKRPENKLAVDVQTQVSGKNLLWSCTTTPVDSPVSRSPVSERALGANQRILRTSLTSSSGSRTNPFDQIPPQNMRRISSISRTVSSGHLGSPSLADSTNSSPHTRYKTYSRLEKQELEAAALLKLRELKSRKETCSDQSTNGHPTNQKENVEATKAAAPGFTIPTITVSTPSETAKPATQPAPLNLPKHAEDGSKSAEATRAPSFIPFPSSTDAPKPSTPAFPSVTSAPPTANDKPTTGPSPSFFVPFTTPSVPASSPGQTLATQSGFGPSGMIASASGQATKPSVSYFPNPELFSNATVKPSVPDTIKSPFTLGSTTQQGEQKVPDAASLANPPQPTSFFNLAKPTTNSTPNSFSSNTPQSNSQITPSDTSANTASQNKFDFKFANSTSSPSTTSSIATANLHPTPVGISTNTGSPFAGMTKAPTMVSFTPLTPDGGAGGFNKPTTSSTTTKPGSDPTSIGFKPSGPSVNGDTFKPATSVFGVAGGSPDSFAASGSPKSANIFGTNTASSVTKPAEASSNETTKPLFKFGVTSGQTSSLSNDTNATQGTANSVGISNTAAAAKPTPTSSSLFNALGPHSTSTFGPAPVTSSASPSTSANLFGTMNTGLSSASAPVNAFGTIKTSLGSAPASVFGAQMSSSFSGSQALSGFGNAGMSNLFDTTGTKPAEAPKPLFGVTSNPANSASVSTAPATEQSNSVFRFHMPTSTTSYTNASAPATTTPNSTSGPQFTFKFNANGASAGSPSTSGMQSAFATKPNVFGINTAFGSAGGPSAPGFSPLGVASQTNATSQK